MSSDDRIEREILLNAPVARVWQALTDHRQFGEWFLVDLKEPFKVGATTTGHVTYPGYEFLPFEAAVERMDEPRLFSFRWPQCDFETGERLDEPPTLVEFHLEDRDGKTMLRVVESGFEKLSPAVRERTLRMNSGGWSEQIGNILRYVERR